MPLFNWSARGRALICLALLVGVLVAPSPVLAGGGDQSRPVPESPTFTHIAAPCPGGDCNPPTCSTSLAGCGSAPYSLSFDHEGNTWWTESRELNSIGRMDARTHAVQLFRKPTEGVIDRIVLGPDGNMWYSDQGEYYNPTPFVGHIGRILTHSPYTITEFVPPTFESRPLGLTVGADHNLWFTEFFSQPGFPVGASGGNAIGRITPFGSDARILASIKEFALPTPKAGPLDIAAGPDGNLWFTEAFVDQVGRITPHGAITEFALPPAASQPVAIASGPDGNVWFTARGSNSVVRILTRAPNTITPFSVPLNPNSLLYFITAGPDDNMWATDVFGNGVVRVLSNAPNTVTEYFDPQAGASPRDIKCGPDGNLWLAEQGTNTLGQVHLNEDSRLAPLFGARCRFGELLPGRALLGGLPDNLFGNLLDPSGVTGL